MIEKRPRLNQLKELAQNKLLNGTNDDKRYKDKKILIKSLQARLGIPAEHIRENMRHASHQTTMIYVYADDGERVEYINVLKW